eukprot:jgi/Mesvir1/7011/Mv09143-RA.1
MVCAAASPGMEVLPETLDVEITPEYPSYSGASSWAIDVLASVSSSPCQTAHEQRTAPPLSLTCVIDKSGSMLEGGKLETVKSALLFLLSQMTDKDKLGIITYDSVVSEVAPLTTLGKGKGQEALRRAIQNIQVGDMTNLSGGLAAGIAQQQSEAYAQDVVRDAGTLNPGRRSTSSRQHTSRPALKTSIPHPTDAPAPRHATHSKDSTDVMVARPSAAFATASGHVEPPSVPHEDRHGRQQPLLEPLSTVQPLSVAEPLSVVQRASQAFRSVKSRLGSAAVLSHRAPCDPPQGAPHGRRLTDAGPRFCGGRSDADDSVSQAGAMACSATPGACPHPPQAGTCVQGGHVYGVEAKGRADASGKGDGVAQGEVDAPLCCVFLFTDGLANKGVVDSRAIVDSTVRSLHQSTRVFTFGLGEEHDGGLLSTLADAGRGMYYFVRDPLSVAGAFVDALGGLLSLAAENTRMVLVPLNGAVLKDVASAKYPVVPTGDGGAVVMLGDLCQGERRDLLVQLAIPALSAPTQGSAMPQEVLSVTVEYTAVGDSWRTPPQERQPKHLDKLKSKGGSIFRVKSSKAAGNVAVEERVEQRLEPRADPPLENSQPRWDHQVMRGNFHDGACDPCIDVADIESEGWLDAGIMCGQSTGGASSYSSAISYPSWHGPFSANMKHSPGPRAGEGPGGGITKLRQGQPPKHVSRARHVVWKQARLALHRPATVGLHERGRKLQGFEHAVPANHPTTAVDKAYLATSSVTGPSVVLPSGTCCHPAPASAVEVHRLRLLVGCSLDRARVEALSAGDPGTGLKAARRVLKVALADVTSSASYAALCKGQPHGRLSTRPEFADEGQDSEQPYAACASASSAWPGGELEHQSRTGDGRRAGGVTAGSFVSQAPGQPSRRSSFEMHHAMLVQFVRDIREGLCGLASHKVFMAQGEKLLAMLAAQHLYQRSAMASSGSTLLARARAPGGHHGRGLLTYSEGQHELAGPEGEDGPQDGEDDGLEVYFSSPLSSCYQTPFKAGMVMRSVQHVNDISSP